MNAIHLNVASALVLILTLAAPITTCSAESARPNILLVLVDDMGWRDCGFMGSDFFETPNMDRLAVQGMVFSNAYAAASNCAPSRACLLSGQYTPRHQIFNVGTRLRGKPQFSKLKHIPGRDVLDPSIVTWASCLQSVGYITASIGKWHLSEDPVPYGFDLNIAGSHSGSPPRGYFPPHPGAPGLENSASNEYLTDRLNEEAIQFVEANAERPWMLYLTHFAVHTPLEAKPDLIEKYQRKPAGKLHNSAVMAAMIESLDAGLGRLVDKLNELKLAQNTVIIFTSDNGGYGPATSMHPLKGYKGTYYEGGIREPFFVVWPGVVPPGSHCEQPICNIDLYPTLCEIAGVPLPTGQACDGVSLVPVLKGERDLKSRSLFWHFPAYLEGYSRADQQRDPIFRTRPCSIIREGQWKLHEYFEDGAIELYDLQADIGESNNLAASHPAQAAELLEKLRQWREDIGAPVPTAANPKYDPIAEQKEFNRIQSKSR